MNTFKSIIILLALTVSYNTSAQDYLIVTTSGDTTEAWDVLIGFKNVEYNDANGAKQTIEKKSVEKYIEYKDFQKSPLTVTSNQDKEAGELLEKAASQKNTSYILKATGATVAIGGYVSGDNDITVIGLIVGGFLQIGGLIMDIVSTQTMKRAGGVLQAD